MPRSVRPRRARSVRARGLIAALLLACGPSGPERDERTVVVFPGSRVGAEGRALEAALERFARAHPDVRVELRPTPDAADQRHQLYVSWLNAREPDPDILQLDVIWVAEFARAGWIRPLDDFEPETGGFFPATLAASRWQGRLYALPWFVDVGMLYWRTDLLAEPPATFDELTRAAESARARAGIPYGLVWQGARYEGLVTVFLEYLTGFGGRMLDEQGRVALDSGAAVRALSAMSAAVAQGGIVPRDALAWTEERTRLAFQNGHAVFMRNWPYAFALLQDPQESRVAGRFAVAPMPAGPGGRPAAALGGQQLAVNARSDVPEAASAVIRFLTGPAEMLERARLTGQYPTRTALFEGGELAGVLAAPPDAVRSIIERAVPRPQVPAYSEISQALQIWLHRALEGSEEPATALASATRDMQAILDRVARSGAAGN